MHPGSNQLHDVPDDEPTGSLVRVLTWVLEHERLRLHDCLHPDPVLLQLVRTVLRLDERRVFPVFRCPGSGELATAHELHLPDGLLPDERYDGLPA